MQIHRLIEILLILLDKEKVTSDELAKKLEVSKRTIYRDIECMSQANIPVVMSKGYNGGISLMEGYTLNKTFLTDDEKQEVLAALSAVASVDAKSNNAIAKLASIFDIDNFDWVEVDFSNWYNVGNIEEKFEQIKECILKKTIIAIEYISIKGEDKLRKVAPIKLCFKSQAWYMYAFCYVKNDYRFFKLSRIKQLNITMSKHQIKAPKKVLKKIEYFKDELITAKFKIDKSQGGRVYDEFSNIRICESGDFEVEITCSKNYWLYNYILSYSEYIKVLEPKELKQEIVDYLQKIMKNFD